MRRLVIWAFILASRFSAAPGKIVFIRFQSLFRVKKIGKKSPIIRIKQSVHLPLSFVANKSLKVGGGV